MKSKSRPEPLCLSYFQYFYQQLHSENELGISFQMSFVLLDWKHRKIISMLAPTLFSWWKFWKIYPTRIWRNPDYWWIDWQWTLFDSQTQRLKFKLRKHQTATKATRSILKFSGSETQIIDEKTDNELFFLFHRPNGWSSKASKKPQWLLDPRCTSQEAWMLQRDLK